MENNNDTPVTITAPTGQEVTGTTQQVDTHTPADAAAAFFGMQKTKLAMLLENMSAKQMRRILMNACSFPFVDKQYTPRTDEERSAAYLVGEMLTNRMIMQLQYEMQLAEEAVNNQEVKGEKEEND